MIKTEYLAPRSLDEALKALELQTGETRIIAGGTDLIPRMRSGLASPTLLVDIRLLDLNVIELKSGVLHIGAGVTHNAIVESDVLSVHCPALIEAALNIAGPPVRNRGTLGGNLANASPAADLAPPLLAYDAYVVISKSDGVQEIPLANFFTGPGKTILNSNKILKEIRIELLPSRTAAKFIKMGKRKAMAISVVNVCTRLTLDNMGRISAARIALGSVAPTPIRALKAEAVLEGKKPRFELFAEAGHVASVESSPISDIRASADYRRKMVAVLTKRALVDTWNHMEKAT